MEETRTQLVMVTEAVYASAENLLRRFEGLPRAVTEARKDARLSELEVKAGLLQVPSWACGPARPNVGGWDLLSCMHLLPVMEI